MKPQPTSMRERGSISVFIAVLGVAFVMVAGLALDGGRKLGALSDAHGLAVNAARAGAQSINIDAYHQTGIATLDPDAATRAATAYLAATGHSGDVAVTADTVTVTVHLRVRTTLLPGPWTVSGTASATATFGVEGTP